MLPQAAACSSCVSVCLWGGGGTYITYKIELWHDKAYSQLNVNCIFVPWGECPQRQLSTSPLVLFLPPVQLLGGLSLYIPEETNMLAAYSCMVTCRLLGFSTQRLFGTWNPWWQSEHHRNKTEGFICCFDAKCTSLQIFCVFAVWNADELIDLHISRSCKRSLAKITGVILSWKTAHLHRKIRHLKWVTEF